MHRSFYALEMGMQQVEEQYRLRTLQACFNGRLMFGSRPKREFLINI
jgi:hypothetical protein